MKFSQLIEYHMTNISPEGQAQNVVKNLFSDPFLKN